VLDPRPMKFWASAVLLLFLIPLTVLAQTDSEERGLALPEPLPVSPKNARENFLDRLGGVLAGDVKPQTTPKSDIVPGPIEIELRVRREGDTTGTLIIKTSSGPIIMPAIRLAGDGMEESLELAAVLCRAAVENQRLHPEEGLDPEESPFSRQHFFGGLALHMVHGVITLSLGGLVAYKIIPELGVNGIWIPIGAYFLSPLILMKILHGDRFQKKSPSVRQRVMLHSLHLGTSLTLSAACAAGLSVLLF